MKRNPGILIAKGPFGEADAFSPETVFALGAQADYCRVTGSVRVSKRLGGWGVVYTITSPENPFTKQRVEYGSYKKSQWDLEAVKFDAAVTLGGKLQAEQDYCRKMAAKIAEEKKALAAEQPKTVQEFIAAHQGMQP